MMSKKYTEVLVGKFDITDIDLEYYYPNNDDNRVEIHSPNNYNDIPPPRIDELIEKLTTLKNKGAERVYIDSHIDHHGFYFYGIKLMDYVPKKIKAWVVIKESPYFKVGEKYIYDDNFGEYYSLDNKRKTTKFNDFKNFPELFEEVILEI